MSLIKNLLALAVFSLIITESHSFTFNGFRSSNLSLDGISEITANGLLRLSNATRQQAGHAFYPNPFVFKNASNGSDVLSFSTTFVFAIYAALPDLGGNMAFVISPTRGPTGFVDNRYLNLFNQSNNGNSSNHVLAIEIDTLWNKEFHDIDGNHVGIDINGMVSMTEKHAAFFDHKTQSYRNMSLSSGKPIQLWLEYESSSQQLNVTIAPLHSKKPSVPLLSLRYDLSSVLNRDMYVGFSCANLLTPHYVLGWSFQIGSVEAPPLDLSQLPKLPRFGPKKRSIFLTVELPFIFLTLLPIVIFTIVWHLRRKRKYAELLEGWELEYVSHRFRYKDLYVATKGFKESELLGRGGFGKVYRGIIRRSRTEIAVKRVSHESRQGIREFVAEIGSIGRLRHRNLVPLLGYCRRKGELLLVYEYMPHGSLDKFLHDQPKFPLNWDQRFQIIKGVASGLLFLHEGWEQVVIHRDIKASNVLLDGDFNARLGDFGLARLYDHGSDPQTTHVVGTLGYLAPEHALFGKATPSTDVYAFGAFMLEVACGRRPVDLRGPSNDDRTGGILMEWVYSLLRKGQILGAVDPNLGSEYDKEEVELVLKLALLCSHSRPEIRPRMRHVVQYLDGAMALPELSALDSCGSGLAFAYIEGFDDVRSTYGSTSLTMFSGSLSVTDSLYSSGR